MQSRDDQYRKQDRPGQNHQKVFVDGVRDVLEDFRQSRHGDGFGVSVIRRTVVDDVLKMAEQFGEIVPVAGHRWVVMHADNDGGGVPDAVAVHVVGEVAVLIAVNGWVHVVGVFDEQVEQARRLLNDLVDAVLAGYGVFASFGKEVAVKSDR